MSDFKVAIKSIIKVILLWSRNLTFVVNNPIRLGGPHVIVQIDENKLNHNVKSHRDRGFIRAIVDTFTQPAKGFATMIPERRAETIIPIIESVVRPGSITILMKQKHIVLSERVYRIMNNQQYAISIILLTQL